MSDHTGNEAKVTEVDEEGTVTPTDLDGLKSGVASPGGGAFINKKLTESQIKANKRK